ncbi:archaellin/type IV pilin N-terminal domain-containing protein [Thermofilum sp.]|uniref:archaellin/type IV pilin N-terminal domain-containing protein n=1 Tax=Thermofilum sp. TaxID=1961369 RepID=UPI0031756F58
MRTGVSPVIATLLLIVIAVAAAVLAYIWIIGYQGTLTQQASTAQLQERIKIEAVQYTGGTLTVYVRNIGDVNVVIDALYVIDKTGTIIGSSSGVGLTLTPGQVDSGTVSATLNSGETYTVKAVTEKGTEATYTFTYRT